MDPRQLLLNVPRLAHCNADRHARPCKICGDHALFFDVLDLNKTDGMYPFGPSGVSVDYHQCDSCGFLFTEFFDAWSPEDFGRFIYNDDYRLIDPDYLGPRPIGLAREMASRFQDFRQARILDYGAGSALFGAEMRNRGYDVTSYDPISLPIRPEGQFDIITAFEVFEHSPDPMAMMADICSFLSPEGCIVFSQTIQPPDIDVVRGNWYYCMPRNGHVSMYQLETLIRMAQRHGLALYSEGGGLHAMARPGSRMAALAERIGPRPARTFTLLAPRDGPGWHDVEGDGRAAFRWSSGRELRWMIHAPEQVTVRIPVVHQIRDGFMAESRLFIGDREAMRSDVAGKEIRGSAVVQEGPTEAILQMPEPICPALVSGSHDDRYLGLAVRAARQ